MRDTAVVDGSLPNRTIAGLTKGVAFHPWCGSMLAMKVATLQLESGKYLHMDTVDFRDLVDLLRSYSSSMNMSNMSLNREHKGPQSPLENALKQEAAGEDRWLAKQFIGNSRTWQGVRINCPLDISARGGQKFEAVEVSFFDPVREASIACISNLIGMPVKVRAIVNTRKSPELINLAVTYLHVDADPQSPRWGLPRPSYWDWHLGSCVVVLYKDGERTDLSTKQVEVLCSFCMDFLGPLFEASGDHENRGNMQLKNEVLRNLTPSSYALFCSGFERGRRTR